MKEMDKELKFYERLYKNFDNEKLFKKYKPTEEIKFDDFFNVLLNWFTSQSQLNAMEVEKAFELKFGKRKD